MKRSCHWCGRSTRDATATDCESCGGPLPSLPTTVRASEGLLPHREVPPAPPPGPRDLPSAYLWRKRLLGNILMILGLVFTVPFCWTCIAPMIGLPLLIFGWLAAERKIRALREGQATVGELLYVGQDTSTTINGQHPWVLRYSFSTPNGEFQGSCTSWDGLDALREPGEPVQVVFVPGDEARLSALWPPTS